MKRNYNRATTAFSFLGNGAHGDVGPEGHQRQARSYPSLFSCFFPPLSFLPALHALGPTLVDDLYVFLCTNVFMALKAHISLFLLRAPDQGGFSCDKGVDTLVFFYLFPFPFSFSFSLSHFSFLFIFLSFHFFSFPLIPFVSFNSNSNSLAKRRLTCRVLFYSGCDLRWPFPVYCHGVYRKRDCIECISKQRKISTRVMQRGAKFGCRLGTASGRVLEGH